MVSLPSYLKDTTHFLTVINGIFWEPDYFLVTLDVCKLYTSIQHQFGLMAVKYFLKTRSVSLFSHSEMVLAMMEFCLLNNSFLFDGVVYCQSQGTAMGTCFPPSYANLVMGWWEERVVPSIPDYDHCG